MSDKREKLLEVEAVFARHLIIFDGHDSVELSLDGETMDIDAVLAIQIIGVLEGWLERKHAPAPAKVAMSGGTPTEREFGDVVRRIIDQVPAEETTLRGRLDRLRYNASYTAPEDMRRRWVELAAVLGEALPEPPAHPWQEKIGRIIRAEE